MFTIIFIVVAVLAVLVAMKVWPVFHDFVMHWWTLAVAALVAVAAMIADWLGAIPSS